MKFNLSLSSKDTLIKVFYTNQNNIKFSFQMPTSYVGFPHLVFEMCHDFPLIIKYKNEIKLCHT